MSSLVQSASVRRTSGETRPASELGRRSELVVLLAVALIAGIWTLGPNGSTVGVRTLLVLLPAVIGLQHGFGPAGIAVILTTIAARLSGGEVTLQALLEPLVAPFALALWAGHHRDRVVRARRELEQKNLAQATQLEQLFREHSVLRASHAQLEERMAAQEWSLEAAVRDAVDQVARGDLTLSASAVLQLLAVQGRVGGAALYLARGTQLPRRADAQLGSASGRSDQRLVEHAFRSGSIVSLQDFASAGVAPHDDVLVAIPLVTTRGTTVGVVAVHDLPFSHFHDLHFALLATLLGPFADMLAEKLEQSLQQPQPEPRDDAVGEEPPVRISIAPAPLAIPCEIVDALDEPIGLPPPTRALAWLEREAARATEEAALASEAEGAQSGFSPRSVLDEASALEREADEAQSGVSPRSVLDETALHEPAAQPAQL